MSYKTFVLIFSGRALHHKFKYCQWKDAENSISWYKVSIHNSCHSNVLYVNFPRIFTNINIVQTSTKSSIYWANIINNQFSERKTSFWICIDVYKNHKDLLPASYYYKTLINHFHKSTTSIKVILPNSIMKMLQLQKNRLFDT